MHLYIKFGIIAILVSYKVSFYRRYSFANPGDNFDNPGLLEAFKLIKLVRFLIDEGIILI